jgi:hypothetical protein
MSEKLTIPLTGRRPIWDNEYEFQANRVRRHADGRAIYGVYATNFQNGQTAVACWTPERISRRQSTAYRIDGTAARRIRRIPIGEVL